VISNRAALPPSSATDGELPMDPVNLPETSVYSDPPRNHSREMLIPLHSVSSVSVVVHFSSSHPRPSHFPLTSSSFDKGISQPLRLGPWDRIILTFPTKQQRESHITLLLRNIRAARQKTHNLMAHPSLSCSDPSHFVASLFKIEYLSVTNLPTRHFFDAY